MVARPAGVLSVTPTNGLSTSGFSGGPFSPSSRIYTLTNSGNATLAWAANKAQSWVTLSATSGILSVGRATTVTVSINSTANSLAVGSYSDSITFTNVTNGNGTTSRAVGLVVNPIPAPSGLTATAISTNQISLSWIDNTSGVDGFLIERALDGGGTPAGWTQISSVGPNVTNYNDSGLSPGTTYWYRVRADNQSWYSDYSDQSGATTLPLPPSGLVATSVSYKQIDLSWIDNSSNEDGFKIDRSVDGTNFTQIAQVLPNTTVYRDSGVWPGTTYYYLIYTRTSAGISAPSNISSAKSMDLCSTSVVGWGYNGNGQATPPPGLVGVVSTAGGYLQSLALMSDGTVVGWGDDVYGGATPPAGLTGVVAVATGWYQSLALTSDGTVVGWGNNYYGQALPPAGLTNVVAIAAGGYHSLALKSDGTVLGWGYDSDGETTPPAGLSGVVAIAAGGYHSLALKSNGTVIGWGSNDSGEATPPPGLTNVVAIAAGNFHSLALKGDGTVVGWGG